jgi:hypothetical protein
VEGSKSQRRDPKSVYQIPKPAGETYAVKTCYIKVESNAYFEIDEPHRYCNGSCARLEYGRL